eukprot:gene2987-12995_t
MTREKEDFFEQYRQPRGGGTTGSGPGRGGFRQAQVKAFLKESVQTGHKTGLPSKLLELFEARPVPDRGYDLSRKKPKPPAAGLASVVEKFAEPGDPEYEPQVERPPEPRLCRNRELPFQARLDGETKAEKKIRVIQWQKEEENVKNWEPSKDPKVEGDPYKTLFVSRLSFDVTEKKLRREFDEFGQIKSLRIVYNKEGKHRGYAFIEYEHKKDMKEAYKQADGRKIEGRRVVVDVERGRTVENWRPRRLGGGLGGQGREPKAPKKGGGGLPVAPAVDDDRRGGAPRGEEMRGGPRGDDQRPARERSPRRERPRSPAREAVRSRPEEGRKRERSRSPRRAVEEERRDDKRRNPDEDRDRRERRRERDIL